MDKRRDNMMLVTFRNSARENEQVAILVTNAQTPLEAEKAARADVGEGWSLIDRQPLNVNHVRILAIR